MRVMSCAMLALLLWTAAGAEEAVQEDKKLTAEEIRQRLDRTIDRKGGTLHVDKFLKSLQTELGLAVRFAAEHEHFGKSVLSSGGLQQVPVRTALDWMGAMLKVKWEVKDGFVELAPAPAGQAPVWPDHPGLVPLGSVGLKKDRAQAPAADPKVAQALAAKLEVSFRGTLLPAVVQVLAEKAGVPIDFQTTQRIWQTLPVSQSFKGKTLKEALDWIAECSGKLPNQKGLVWVQRGNRIEIGSMGDTTAAQKPMAAGPGAGPAVGPAGR